MTMPAISLAAVTGRRQQTLEVAAEIERRGFTGIFCPSICNLQQVPVAETHYPVSHDEAYSERALL